MDRLEALLTRISAAVWGTPLILLILSCGAYLTVKLRVVQFRKLGTAFSYLIQKDPGGEKGGISGFAALCTSLSASLGTGNIAGAAAAVSAGGPGALLWMELSALLGMAVKYAEGYFAVTYRTKDKAGNILGGPFCYIEKGMGRRFRPLAVMFAAACLFAGLAGIGTAVQMNSIVTAADSFFRTADAPSLMLFGRRQTLVTVLTGTAAAVCAAAVMKGGIARTARFSQAAVPVMSCLYILCTLAVILRHSGEIPGALAEMVRGAFGLRPAAGAAAGITLRQTVRCGISRGIFSNEAGLGTAPIAAAAADTKDPARQGLVMMTGVFIDTVIVCTMTGLAVTVSGAWKEPGLEGVQITAEAFRRGLCLPGRLPELILMLCISLFAFTTITGWGYYSERCLTYLCGGSSRAGAVFRTVCAGVLFISPYLGTGAVWALADISNALMAVPNMAALIWLGRNKIKQK